MLELICLTIVAVYVVVRARLDPDRPALFRRLATTAVASFVAEDTVIHAYGFYAYADVWTIYVDRVPLLVTLIWPVVLSSARDLSVRLAGQEPGRVPLLSAAIVLFDAWLIEPVAVHAGLWSWTEPGLFSVPPIGVFGWAYFAYFAALAHDRRLPGGLASAVVATHLVLVATWWGGFRWISGPVPHAPVVVGLWALSITLATVAWRRELRARVPPVEVLVRIPGAVFFFVLLAVTGAGGWLTAWALAFAPPYLALTRLPARSTAAP